MKPNEIAHHKENQSPIADFSKFEQTLQGLGLACEDIIAPPEERARIMAALPGFLESLLLEIRKDARYLRLGLRRLFSQKILRTNKGHSLGRIW